MPYPQVLATCLQVGACKNAKHASQTAWTCVCQNGVILPFQQGTPTFDCIRAPRQINLCFLWIRRSQRSPAAAYGNLTLVWGGLAPTGRDSRVRLCVFGGDGCARGPNEKRGQPTAIETIFRHEVCLRGPLRRSLVVPILR